MTPPSPTRSRSLLLGLSGGLGYALACTLSFAPVSIWPLSLLALPLLLIPVLLAPRIRPLYAALGAAAGTLPLWIWTHGWVFGVAWPGAVGLVIYLALFPLALIWITLRIRDRVGLKLALWVWPWAWFGLEWLRSEVIWGGYAWFSPSQGLIHAPALPWAAGVVGAHGILLLLSLLSAGLIGMFLTWRAHLSGIGYWALASTAVAVAWAGLSWWGRAPAPEGPFLRVAAVQTATSQSVRGVWATADRLDTMELLIDLSRDAGATQPPPDVIVWPETMFPGDTLAPADVQAERDADLIWFERPDRKTSGYQRLVWRGRDGTEPPSAITQMAPAGERMIVPSLVCADTLLFWQGIIGIPMLIGTDGFERLRIVTDARGVPDVAHDGRYNSVFLLEQGQVRPERYDKHHLTPFGEVMPGLEHSPLLQNWLLNVGIGATGMRFDLSRGVRGPLSTRFEFTASDGSTVRVATPICFEATAAWRCRELVAYRGARKADVLIGLTNDGWFGRWPAGREAHLDLARWRSVELWTPLIRSANTGVSASIDGRGRVLGRYEAWQTGVLMSDARAVQPLSPYARGGYTVVWLGPIGLIVMILSLLMPAGLFQRSAMQKTDIANEQQPRQE